MVSRLNIQNIISKTDKQKKSGVVKKNKKQTNPFTDCDWTVDGAPPIELSDIDISEV
jgi:hypothetical protein